GEQSQTLAQAAQNQRKHAELLRASNMPRARREDVTAAQRFVEANGVGNAPALSENERMAAALELHTLINKVAEGNATQGSTFLQAVRLVARFPADLTPLLAEHAQNFNDSL